MGGSKGWSPKYVRRLAMTDLAALLLTVASTHYWRFGWERQGSVQGAYGPSYWLMSIGLVALWMAMLSINHSRSPRNLGHGPEEFYRAVQGTWRTFAVVAVLGFLAQWQISRGYLVFALVVGTIALLAGRGVWRLWIHRQRDRGGLRAQVIVVGPVRTTEQLVRRLRRNRRSGYHVVGVCVPSATEKGPHAELEGVPVLGGLADAATIAREVGAEYLVLSGTDELSLRESRDLGWELEGSDVGLIVAPSMVDVAGPRVRMSPVEGLPLLYVDAPRYRGGKFLIKGAFDRTFAALLLAVLAIPMVIVGLLVRATSPGPALFLQERVGRDHQRFRMYKFRSMYADAEQRRADVLGSHGQNAGNGVLFKASDDPRITPIGKVLRRFSIDELPQFIDVFKGDMSIVGPRPPLPIEVEAWESRVSRRQLVKPGITGLWQVSGRSDLDWESSVRLDLYYAENWSLATDALIVLRTVWAVAMGRGAY